MDTQNCAAEAPRRGFAGHPTGFRRLTPGLLKVDRTAECFAGLPEGVEVPGQLLAAFKAAAPRLGLSARLVHAVDWLFRFTQPQDWQEGGRPIVWPSAGMQQEAFGLSESRVKAVNRLLAEAGLVTMKDSPNGKRYGRRDGKGRIVEAYGFDLSPLAARHAEFVRLAEEGRAEREMLRRLRRRATIARKGIAQIVETALEYGFAGEEWVTLARDTRGLVRALREVARPDEVEVGVASLERRQCGAKARLEELLKIVDSDPKGPENEPHITTTNQVLNLEQDTVIASEVCNEPEARPALPPPRPVLRGKGEKEKVLRVLPDELVRLAPRLKPYLRGPAPSWPDIVDAADWLRHDLDVSKPLWADACLTMGREVAAIAVAIVSAKDPEHFRTTPGAYFHGMVAKAKAGELNLDRTIWALRRALEPKHHRGNGRAGERGGGEPRAW
jgi:replication initiation protein RepC